MRYVTWVESVFRALADAESVSSLTGGVSLTAVAQRLGLGALSYEEFARHEEPGEALMTAMSDLDRLGLVAFANVAYGNKLTQPGRDVLARGFALVRDECLGVLTSPDQRAFLARLHAASEVSGEAWADLQMVDPAQALPEPPQTNEYTVTVLRSRFLQDLRNKGLVWSQLGDECRPTYVASVLLTESNSAERRAGIVDWGEPLAGFEIVEDRIAELKLRLAGAATDDDLSDVGRRCRDLYADAVDVVFRPEMVSTGAMVPSRQDAEERLRWYLAVAAPSQNNTELRKFVRAALGLAHARTHSFRTGRVAAVAAVQGVLAFVRTMQAIERSRAKDGPTRD